MMTISNLSYLVNASVIHILFNNMDLGDLSFVSFSTVDMTWSSRLAGLLTW